MVIKHPSQKARDAALKDARMHLYLLSDIRCRPSDEARMLARVHAKAAKLARTYRKLNPGLKLSDATVLQELNAEARRRGPLCPVLGKDL